MKSNILIPIILSIFFVSLIGSLYLRIQKNNTNYKISKHPTNPSPSIILIPTEINDTSTWQTYRNDKYGFEFDYSRDLFLSPEGDLWKNESDYKKYLEWQKNIGESPIPQTGPLFYYSIYQGALDYTAKHPRTDTWFIRKLSEINSNIDIFHTAGETEGDLCIFKIKQDSYLQLYWCNPNNLKNPEIIRVLQSLRSIN